MPTDASELQYTSVTRIAGQDELYAVDVVERADGKKSLCTDSVTTATIEMPIYDGFIPEPGYSITPDKASPQLDIEGNLRVRSQVLTDEGSFRDDFNTNSTYSQQGIDVTYTNGSDIVTSVSPFTFEFKTYSYIKKESDPDTELKEIVDFIDDYTLQLAEPYTGITGTYESEITSWYHNTVNGATYTSSNSKLTLTTPTTSGACIYFWRRADYCPLRIGARLSVTQRIANQEIIWGVSDNENADNTYAVIKFSGTSKNIIVFETAHKGVVQTTTITFPVNKFDSSEENKFFIPILPNKCALFVNEEVVAVHEEHVPGTYDTLGVIYKIENTGTTASSTSVSSDWIFITNMNRLNIANEFIADPVQTSLVGKTDDGILIPVKITDSGELLVSSQQEEGGDFHFGDVAASVAGTEYVVRRTAYTEKTSASIISIASSSANDTALGTGARTVRIEYFDNDCKGKYIEEITLNGTTAVNSVNSNIRYIDHIEVLTAGSGGKNAGTLTLYAAANAGGGAVGTIAIGDNQTYWAHKYVDLNSKTMVTGFQISSNANASGKGGRVFMRYKPFNIADSVNLQKSNSMYLTGAEGTLNLGLRVAIPLSGAGLITMCIVPDSNSALTFRAAFDFYNTQELK